MLAFILTCFEMGIQVVWKKKQFEKQKHHNEFNYDDCPQFFTNCHRSKTIVIKPEYMNGNSFNFHSS